MKLWTDERTDGRRTMGILFGSGELKTDHKKHHTLYLLLRLYPSCLAPGALAGQLCTDA